MTRSTVMQANCQNRIKEAERSTNGTLLDTLIENRSLLPVFQSIHDVLSMEICGYEFLARTEICGGMTPRQMFTLAEKTGRSTIVELSELCRECGVQYAIELGLESPIYLNTHPAENLLGDVLPQLKKLRQQYGGNRWVLELHENLSLNQKEIAEIVMRLENLNIELALDDVGSGYDRIGIICESGIGIVKLCRNLVSSSISTHVLKNLVRFIQSSGAVVIAEGIETLEQLERCQQIEIDFAQGFYFGKPGLILGPIG